MVEEISSKDFENILKNDKVVIDCYAPWCGPCRMLSPIIDELASEINNINFYKLNVDNNNDIATKFGIMSIPTILIFENSNLKDKIIGFRSKDELIEIINK